MSSIRTLPVLLPAITAIAFGSMLAILSAADVLSQRVLFTAITLLLLAYLTAELSRLRRAHPQRWVINPIAMASFLTFGLSFGVTNILFFLPPETIGAVGLVPEVTPAMVKLMWLVLMGAIAMWLGYWSPLAARLSGPAMQRKAARWIRKATKPRPLAVPLLAAAALFARLIQVRLGLFGYSSDHGQLMKLGGITQYLGMLASLGLLALLLAALTYFWHPGSAPKKAWLIGLIVVEVGFGFLSGFKSQVAMPFVIVGVCAYLRDGRIPAIWIFGFVAALITAYAVIEPFRDASRVSGGFDDASFVEIAETMASAQDETMIRRDQVPVWISILSRSSLISDGSAGIAYMEMHGKLPDGSPAFLKNMLLAPAYAWIPRLIWTEKPVGDLGLWYTRVIMNRNLMSATASGPFTYLYLAGGVIAIAVFFGLLGVTQRAYYFLLTPFDKPAGALIFLAMLPTMANIASSVDGMLVDIFRTIPLLVLMQFMIFRRSSQPY